MERDVIFPKTIKLLHSNAKDAEDQLKSLLEEVVKQKYGISKTFANFFNKKDPKRESNSKSHSRKEERKSFEKHSDDSSESSSTKRPKIDSKSSSNHHQSSQSEISTPLNQAIIDLINVEPPKKKNVKSDDDDDDDDDFSLEILEEELTCVVCRGMEVGVRNQLVECLECHSLYHQECHKPPVSEEDMKDPRSAWYCANCSTSLNKPSKQGARSSPKLSSSKHDSPHSHNIFKRSDSKSGHSSKSSTSPTPIGMAGLAASFQPSSKSSYSSSSSKSSSKSKKRF